MPKINQNLVGQKFGHLTVLSKSKERGTQREYKWLCQCDCGRKTLVTTAMLNSGSITSCGHVRLEKSKQNLKPSDYRHKKQLNNRLPSNNVTGYKNISLTKRHNQIYYRISVQYDRKSHQKLAKSLKEALKIREEFRKKWWPNYK